MIDTEALRKKVIDLAIQGKLTEQLPSDGDAETLYAQIQEEKAKLVKEGKIKKDKPSAEISNDEILFDIPSNWKWVHLNEIAVSSLGKTLNKSTDKGELCRYLCSINVQWDEINLETVKTARFHEDEKEKYKLNRDDLLICEGGDSGRCAIWDSDEEMYYQNALHRVRFFCDINPRLYCYIIEYYKKSGIISFFTKGIGIQHLVQSSLYALWLPLPPLSEQNRIVEKVQSVMGEIDIIDDLQAKYSKDLAVLKSKIIDAGIQGKLTEQLLEDGDAEDLYKQIQEEKEKLTKEGKIKKEKPLPDIVADEIPFEIPKNWKWVHFNGIGVSSLGKTLNKSTDKGDECRYLCSINVQWEGINFNTVKTARFDEGDKEKYRLQRGDLLICEGGDSGRCAIWDSDEEMYYQNALHRVRFFGDINPTFYSYVMEAYKKSGIITNYTTGIGIQHLVQASLNSIWLPLPPVSEQERIVAKVESILEQLNS